MMKHLFLIIYVIAAALPLSASEPWSVERCMQYAADHSHTVRQQQFALEDSRAAKTQAIGAFLPSVYGSVDGQMNFGRAIDPSTNTYTDVSTLYNGYGLQASLVVFDGLQRYNNLRLAKANEAMGRSGVRAEKDDVALKVYKAYMDLVYCEGAVSQTAKKRDESRELLRQTSVMAEVGQKSDADVAQMRATLAADEYELAHMQSQTTKAMLALKQLMGFPVDSALAVIQPSFDDEKLTAEDASQISAFAATDNPRILKAQQNVEAARYSLRAARGALLPTISLSGGVSTSFFRNMDKGGHASFSSQFRNNAGEYVGLSLSIPLFDRLATYSTIRRRKTALVQAQENLAYEQSELRRIIVEAASDVENSTKKVEKMQEQVEADSIASRLTTRKYEEGLASSIDVKTAAVTLLQSRVRLLQSQLTMAYNRKLLAYYKGEKLWTDL
uniref:TolC family protein n=1 Tax=Prevotella sp. TaxID=59823 RepID=UPI0040289BC0